MKTKHIFTLISLGFLLLTGCALSADRSPISDLPDGKLQYSPQINEVTVIKLQRQDFPLQILSNGTIAATKKTVLHFRESGVVKSLSVQNGQDVEEGEIIATLEDSALKSALESSRIELDRAELDMQDALVGLGFPTSKPVDIPDEIKKMVSIRSGYRAAKNKFEMASMSLGHTVLKAPFSGKIANLNFKIWDTVSGSDSFCTIIGNDGFDVDFTVLESEYPLINKGQSVIVSLFGDSSDIRVRGSIKAINPLVDKNGQISVIAHIDNNPRFLDGMNVKVCVNKILEKQLVVPKKAVVIRDGLEVLFRYKEDGTAEWVYVQTIKANSESYAVTANKERSSTLDENDIIIVTGNLNLADGSKVSLKQK